MIDIDTEARDLTLDRPSQAVYIPRPGAAPIGPFLISPAGLIRIQQLLSPPLSLVPMIASAAPAEAIPGAGAGPAGPGDAPGPSPGQGTAGGSGPADRPGPDWGPLLYAGVTVVIVALIVLVVTGGNSQPRSP